MTLNSPSTDFIHRQTREPAFPFYAGAAALGVNLNPSKSISAAAAATGSFGSGAWANVKKSLALARYRPLTPDQYYPESPSLELPVCLGNPPPRYTIPCVAPRPLSVNGARPMAVVGVDYFRVMVAWYDDDAHHACTFPGMAPGCTTADLLNPELENAIVRKLCGYARGPRFSTLNELVGALQHAAQQRIENFRRAVAAAGPPARTPYLITATENTCCTETYARIGSWNRTMVLCLAISAVLADACRQGECRVDYIGGRPVGRLDDRFSPVLEYMCRMLAQLDDTPKYRVRAVSEEDAELYYSAMHIVDQHLKAMAKRAGAEALLLLADTQPPAPKRRKKHDIDDDDYVESPRLRWH